MILILSEEQDQSTNDVIDWLIFYNKEFVRINYSDKCEIIKVDLNNENLIIKVNDRIINFNDITAYWYRRGDFNIKLPVMPVVTKKYKEIIPQISKNLTSEIGALVNFFHFFLQGKKSLSCYLDNHINKLENLIYAKRCGLTIPNTIISSNKNEILEFICENNSIITKAISETIMFLAGEEGALQSYTNEVTQETLDDFDDFLFPSLFQNTINKKYELRIFYLDGNFYAMAIFSQSNNKTKTDFRKYDKENPNRYIPFNIPSDIKIKLKKFMILKNYTSGSIDMVVDKDDNYIFLEINPVGQFGMTSIPCNYYLNKKIAEYLCK